MLTAEVALAVQYVHRHVEHPGIVELRLKTRKFRAAFTISECFEALNLRSDIHQ